MALSTINSSIPKKNAGVAGSKRNYWQRWREQNPIVCSTTWSKRGLSFEVVGDTEVGRATEASGITVAVGTTIADRSPPHRSVRARLRIRLLRRMSGVEASIRIGVQNAGRRNPPVQDWGKSFPTHLRALTTADQNTLPYPAHAKLEDA